MKEFKDRLKSIRESKNMTQEDLAGKTGLTHSWISHFETGGRKPSLKTLVKLADSLEVSLDELVGRE